MQYELAMKKAEMDSLRLACVQHVNAIILRGVVGGPNAVPVIVGYEVRDWSDGSTVASFENGRKL